MRHRCSLRISDGKSEDTDKLEMGMAQLLWWSQDNLPAGLMEMGTDQVRQVLLVAIRKALYCETN